MDDSREKAWIIWAGGKTYVFKNVCDHVISMMWRRAEAIDQVFSPYSSLA
jgi:hypothetical protein